MTAGRTDADGKASPLEREKIRKAEGWSLSEDELVARYYPENGGAWERWWCNGGDLLEGRTYKALNSRAFKLGVRCRYHGRKSWTHAEDEAALRALASVCRETGRSPIAVVRRLDHLAQKHMARLRAERLGVLDG